MWHVTPTSLFIEGGDAYVEALFVDNSDVTSSFLRWLIHNLFFDTNLIKANVH